MNVRLRNKYSAECSDVILDIYLIPIKPNTKNWTEPDFKKLGTAYAKKWGYGHEEWNNSPKNDFSQNGQKWHAFHSQGFYDKDPKKFNSEHKIFVFMSGSGGVFNGVALNPILSTDKEARSVGNKVRLNKRGKLLWEGIHKCCPNLKESKFTENWNSLDGWKGGFRWKVLKKNFIWFDKPVIIQRSQIDSKSKWGMHYGAPQKLNEKIRMKFWEALRESISYTKHSLDAVEIEQYDPNECTGREEGAKKTIYVNVYERNKKNRDEAIKAYGSKYCCDVCGFDFGKVYGDIGKNFIHVHHIIPLSTIQKNYKINPAKDLVPVCPNCHAMLHRHGYMDYKSFKKMYKQKKKRAKE